MHEKLSDIWWTFVHELDNKGDLRVKAETFRKYLQEAKAFYDRLGFRYFIASFDVCDEIKIMSDCYGRYHSIGSCEHEVADAVKEFRNMLADVLKEIDFDEIDHEWLMMEFYNRRKESADDSMV